MKDVKGSNSGYTLVELIIVIAIIAIMSGVGALTIGSIRTAQATTAMQKFDSVISTLESRTRSTDGSFAMKVVRNAKGDGYDIYYGTYSGSDDPGHCDVTKFTPNDPSSPDEVLERVTIYYNSSDVYDADGASSALGSGDDGDVSKGTIIRIRKSDNMVIFGEGEYKFVKYAAGGTNDSNGLVGRITLSKETGSHTYGKN